MSPWPPRSTNCAIAPCRSTRAGRTFTSAALGPAVVDQLGTHRRPFKSASMVASRALCNPG